MAAAASFQIPSTLIEFSCKFPCTLEQEQEALSALAKQVAHTYARLLTSEGHQNRGQVFEFDRSHPVPPKFPTAEQVSNFETQLANAIVDQVNSKSYDLVSVRLSTHYAPRDLLIIILESTVGKEFEWYRGYFPMKIYTELSLDRQDRVIKVVQWGGTFI